MMMRSLLEVFTAQKTMSAIKVPIGSIILLVILGLVGCVRPTGYVKASSWTSGYGYRDKRMNGDECSIVVLGNTSTSKPRVAEIALLRAAHLTKEQGRTHFAIIKQKVETTEKAVMMSIPLFIGGVLVPVPVGERTDKEPMAILLIRMLSPRPGYPKDAINAAEVIEQLSKHLK